MPYSVREAVNEEVSHMLEMGVVEAAKTPYNAPVRDRDTGETETRKRGGNWTAGEQTGRTRKRIVRQRGNRT